MIKDVEQLEFNISEHAKPQVVKNKDGISTQEKIDEIDINIWKKDYELVQKTKADLIKKEKRVFPIILDQCLPLLRSQLKGAKTEETCETNDRGTFEAHQGLLLQK